MIAVDTNILVYAHRGDSSHHAPAKGQLHRLAGSGEPWAIPWPCIHEFYSIVTHPKVYDPPTTRAHALQQIEAWLEAPSLHLLAEDESHWDRLKTLIVRGQVAGPRVHDARIAALCLAHGVQTLWTADRDFRRFPELSTSNPVV